MSALTVWIREHETSRPLADLQVTWYATPLFSLPEESSDPAKRDHFFASGWKGLDLRRIGSATTEKDGVARFRSDLDFQKHNAATAPNLWFIVQMPQIAGATQCGQIICTACNVIQNFGEQESAGIRIPVEQVARFGIGRNVPDQIDAHRAKSALDEALLRAEKKLRRGAVGAGPRFSAKFNDAVQKATLSKDNQHGGRLHAQSLKVAIAGIETPAQSDAIIVFSARQKRMLLRHVGVEKVLTWAGIASYTNPGLTRTQLGQPKLLVNEEKSTLMLALPKVPQVLERQESEAGDLYLNHQKGRNASNNGKPEVQDGQ
jgi:hypothetical protein